MCIDTTLREEHIIRKKRAAISLSPFYCLECAFNIKKKKIVQYRRTHHYFKTAFTFQGTGALLLIKIVVILHLRGVLNYHMC